jgi:alkylated DNA repair dioxygenase AlkB
MCPVLATNRGGAIAPPSVTVCQSIGAGALTAPAAHAAVIEPALAMPRLRDAGFLHLKHLMTPEAARSLAEDLVQRRSRQQLARDSSVQGAWAAYADPIFQILLVRTQPILERIVAADLYPTYSYARVYERGNDLPSHVDREACELSVTLALGAAGGHRWPFRGQYGDAVYEVGLEPGDAVMYLGHECRHWRGALEADWSAHVFLHYVFADGAFANFKFDAR